MNTRTRRKNIALAYPRWTAVGVTCVPAILALHAAVIIPLWLDRGDTQPSWFDRHGAR